MNLDQVKIAIVARTHLELLDLSLAVIRRHWLGLLKAAAIGIAPVMLFNSFWFADEFGFFGRSADRYDRSFPVLSMMFALFMQRPWATAFMTLYLGQVTFQAKPSWRRVFGDFVRSMPALFLYQGLIRCTLAITFILAPVASLGFRYINELVLLERSTARRTWKRRKSFHDPIMSRIMGGAMLDLFFGVLMFSLGSVTLRAIYPRDLLSDEGYEIDHFDEATMQGYLFNLVFESFSSWSTQLILWSALSFLTVVRFLSYLDYRIRREGWDIELKLRARAEEWYARGSW